MSDKKSRFLVVVDMQNDFVSGSLGTKEAVAIVPEVVKEIESFDGEIVFTKDTHQPNYLQTLEGKNLPVEHCIEGTPGWEIVDELLPLTENRRIFRKDIFGSYDLVEYFKSKEKDGGVSEIELLGLCTDICVISNALLLRSALPQVPICVKASCSAGVTPEKHAAALEVLRSCQVEVL